MNDPRFVGQEGDFLREQIEAELEAADAMAYQSEMHCTDADMMENEDPYMYESPSGDDYDDTVDFED